MYKSDYRCCEYDYEAAYSWEITMQSYLQQVYRPRYDLPRSGMHQERRTFPHAGSTCQEAHNSNRADLLRSVDISVSARRLFEVS